MQKPVVEVDTTIAADPRTVWKAMTRKQSAMFPGTQVETDWEVGHPISFKGEWKGKPFKDKGEIQSFEAEKELSFTHWSEMSGEADRPENYHVVRYRLEPVGGKTRVTLSQFNEGKDTDLDPDQSRVQEELADDARWPEEVGRGSPLILGRRAQVPTFSMSNGVVW